MKSLSESLFDTNVISKKMTLGSLYETDTPCVYGWQNCKKGIIRFFLPKEIAKWSGLDVSKIDPKSSDYQSIAITAVINMILDMPAEFIISNTNAGTIDRKIEDYLLQFCQSKYKQQTSNRMFDAYVRFEDSVGRSADASDGTKLRVTVGDGSHNVSFKLIRK